MTWMRFMFSASKEFCKQLHNFHQRSQNNFISDVSDGTYMKYLIQEFTNKPTLFISALTDGLSLFKTSKSNIWPFCFVLNNLDRTVRRDLRYIFSSCVMDFEKKNFGDLLQFMFFSELKYLQNNSFSIWNCFENEIQQYYACFCFGLMDWDAKLVIANFPNWSSNNPCPTCNYE